MQLRDGVNGNSNFLLQVYINANSLAKGKFHDIYKYVIFLIINVGFSDLCRLFESIVRF